MSFPDGESDEGTGRTYLLVILCEAAVITVLWIFQRVFA